YTEVSGRIAGVELKNFMCHGHLKVDFETSDNNHFYIGGPNGTQLPLQSMKSAAARLAPP
ncbi:hypothetical protein ANCDUO_00759, partial [Ancylostoma duodenale]